MRAPRLATACFLGTLALSSWIILAPADLGRLDGRHFVAVLTLAAFLSSSARKADR